MKKLLLGILLGLTIGIGGEFFIPDKLTMNLTHGCVLSTLTGNVFLPSTSVYSPGQERPYGLYSPNLNLRNYELAWEFLIGDVITLDQKTCNALREMMMENK